MSRSLNTDIVCLKKIWKLSMSIIRRADRLLRWALISSLTGLLKSSQNFLATNTQAKNPKTLKPSLPQYPNLLLAKTGESNKEPSDLSKTKASVVLAGLSLQLQQWSLCSYSILPKTKIFLLSSCLTAASCWDRMDAMEVK